MTMTITITMVIMVMIIVIDSDIETDSDSDRDSSGRSRGGARGDRPPFSFGPKPRTAQPRRQKPRMGQNVLRVPTPRLFLGLDPPLDIYSDNDRGA